MKLSLPCALDVISPKPSESQCPSRLHSPRLIGPGPLPQMGKAWFVEALPHLGEGSHLGKFIVTFLPDWGGRSHSPHVIEPTAGRGPSRSVGWRGAALAFPRQNVQDPLAGRLLEKVAARDVALGTTCPILEGLCSFVHLLRHLSELLEAFDRSGAEGIVWFSDNPNVTRQVLKPKAVSLASHPGRACSLHH